MKKRFLLKDARLLLKREFGTCKGVRYLFDQKPNTYGSGFVMQIGELQIRAVHSVETAFVLVNVSAACMTNSFTMAYDLETLERDFAEEDRVLAEHRRDLFEEWVNKHTLEYCCEQVKKARQG